MTNPTWQQFLKQNKGKGLNVKQLSTRYRALKATSPPRASRSPTRKFGNGTSQGFKRAVENQPADSVARAQPRRSPEPRRGGRRFGMGQAETFRVRAGEPSAPPAPEDMGVFGAVPPPEPQGISGLFGMAPTPAPKKQLQERQRVQKQERQRVQKQERQRVQKEERQRVQKEEHQRAERQEHQRAERQEHQRAERQERQRDLRFMDQIEEMDEINDRKALEYHAVKIAQSMGIELDPRDIYAHIKQHCNSLKTSKQCVDGKFMLSGVELINFDICNYKDKDVKRGRLTNKCSEPRKRRGPISKPKV